MKQCSVSFTLGKASVPNNANVAHNNREFLAWNVDEQRTDHNITYIAEDIEVAYKKLFGEAVAAYNAKQSRPCRRIDDYYSHIANGKREEAFYEIIVQFGDSINAPCGSENGKLVAQLLDAYMKEFQKRNPNLYVFNAVLHLDEASPHLHIDFIPFYERSKVKGLRKGVSMKAALGEMGFKPTKKSDNQLMQWEASEQKAMEKILHRHGIEREDKHTKHKHMSVDAYKHFKDQEKIVQTIRAVHTDAKRNGDARYIHSLESRVEQLEAGWRKERVSPFKSFYYSDSEKQDFVQSELRKRGIPFVETDHGFEAQQIFAKRIRKIEKEYKTHGHVFRDKLRDDIDRLLMQSDSVNEMLDKLRAEGYEVKIGKYISAKPPNDERFIRFKSLGEMYDDLALSNRIDERKAYETRLERQIAQATREQSKYTIVLTTMKFYTLTYREGKLPMKKKHKDKPFTWDNDAQLDALLALNKHLNDGATVSSMQDEAKRLQEEITGLEHDLRVNEKVLRSHYEMREQIQVVYEGKYSDRYAPEEARRELAKYPQVNKQNFDRVYPMIAYQEGIVQDQRASLAETQKQLKDVTSALSVAEQVLNGTYIQSLLHENNLREVSRILENGVMPVDVRRYR